MENQKSKGVAIFVTKLQANFWYTLVIIGLALVSFGFLVYEWLPQAQVQVIIFADHLDTAVALVFLVDFCLGLAFNTQYKTGREYWRHNWLNFISSIPITFEVTQFLRIVRIWRAFRVLRTGLNVWQASQQWKENKAKR